MPGFGRIARLIALLAIIPTCAVASSFVPGAVCAGTDAIKIPDKLNGKHLIIGMLEYEPWASFNRSGNGEWEGFDVSLLNEVAKEAGFTFTLKPVTKQAGETWTEVSIRSTNEMDLITSWWTHTMERRKSMVQLVGHVDASLVLISKAPYMKEVTLTDQMFSFTKPFTADLWGAIFIATIFSGVTLGFLEYGKGDFKEYSTAKNSISVTNLKAVYLSFVTLVKREAPRPRTLMGRIFFVAWGFACLVFIASYTASLTSFLTVVPYPIQEIRSVDDLISKNKKACFDKALPYIEKFGQQGYPNLQFQSMDTNNQPQYIKTEECAAAVVMQADFRGFRKEDDNNDGNCHVEIVGSPLRAQSAGWLTNTMSPCVSQTIDYTLEYLISRGSVDRILRRYLSMKQCHKPADETGMAKLKITDLSGLFIFFGFWYSITMLIRVVRGVTSGECSKDFDPMIPTSPKAKSRYLRDRDIQAELSVLRAKNETVLAQVYGSNSVRQRQLQSVTDEMGLGNSPLKAGDSLNGQSLQVAADGTEGARVSLNLNVGDVTLSGVETELAEGASDVLTISTTDSDAGASSAQMVALQTQVSMLLEMSEAQEAAIVDLYSRRAPSRAR